MAQSQEPLSGEPGFLRGGIFLVFISFLVLYLLRYVTSTDLPVQDISTRHRKK